MYLGVDVGGTKTLLAVFTKDGTLKQSVRFETPQDYDQFLEKLTSEIHVLGVDDFQAACLALPGLLDREHGVAIAFSHLPWKNVPLAAVVEKIIRAPVHIENDVKLGALSEAILIKNEFRKVLYVTISTGISAGLVIGGIIDPDLADSESGQMLLQYDGKLQKWEDFASGKAIVKKYGKRASEINDPKAWQDIAHTIALGLIDVVAVIQPAVVVIGGGVGAHFAKFGTPLKKEMKSYEMSLVPIPPIRGAKRPEEAVIYGCYELLKAKHG